MRLRQQLTRHPLLGLSLAMLALLGVVGAHLFLHFAGEQQLRQGSHYGQALADRAASQAVEPALAQDMISLQVILQSLAEQPIVQGATVHDVENKLLVQSGDSDGEPGHRELTFTAPITLDTHIAGHLSVTLSLAPVRGQYTALLWLWALAVGLCMAALTLFYLHFCARATATGSPSFDVTDADDEPPLDEPAGELVSVTIDLHLLNLDALHQQLSRAGFEQRLDNLDRHLSGILALYTGTRQSFANRCLRLVVTGDSSANACFYAICISELARGLCLSEPSPRLKLAANIRTSHSADGPSRLVDAYRHPDGDPPSPTHSATWVDPRLQDEALMSHIDVTDDNYLSTIKPPYCALLEKQQAQLAALAE